MGSGMFVIGGILFIVGVIMRVMGGLIHSYYLDSKGLIVGAVGMGLVVLGYAIAH